MRFLKKYWIELLFFTVAFALVLKDAAPGMTWINTNSDGIHLTLSARFFYVAHDGSAPLYLILGHFALMIPWGTEFWRMALMSVIGNTAGTVLIYLIIKETIKDNPRVRLFALVGSLLYVTSALVLSQSIIVKYYTLTTAFGLASYYFMLRKHYSTSAAMLGMGAATHPIIVFFAIPIYLFNKPMHRWKYLFTTAAFGLFYLYIPLAAHYSHAPNMWGNLNPIDQIKIIVQTAMMLTGGIAIYDIPKRILDTIGIVGLSLGIGLIVIIIYFAKQKQWWKSQLFWLFMLPIVYFATDLSPETYVYMVPAIAWGCVIAAIQLSTMSKEWFSVTVAVALLLGGYNFYYFDIGKTLDPNLSAAEYFNTELNKIPDGQYFMPYYGWEWAAVWLYNKENNRNIIPISIENLINPIYRATVLDPEGIKYTLVDTTTDRFDAQNEMALSVVALNPNVWTTKTTNASTYGAEVILAKTDLSAIDRYPIAPAITWHFVPSNPYQFISGSIEVIQWANITYSNYSVLFFCMLGLIGFIPTWIFYQVIFAKKKFSLGAKIKHEENI